MKLSNCPCCGGEVKITETQMPDFMIEHVGDWRGNEKCAIYSNCIDICFRAFTIEELIENWNDFCENRFDKNNPSKYRPDATVYCPIAKTTCRDGMIFNGIVCAFTTEYGGCMAEPIKLLIDQLAYEILNKEHAIPVRIDGGELLTYEQNN